MVNWRYYYDYYGYGKTTKQRKAKAYILQLRALYQLAETAKSKPVTNSFDFEDVVGIVLSAKVVKESLIIDVDVLRFFSI